MRSRHKMMVADNETEWATTVNAKSMTMCDCLFHDKRLAPTTLKSRTLGQRRSGSSCRAWGWSARHDVLWHVKAAGRRRFGRHAADVFCSTSTHSTNAPAATTQSRCRNHVKTFVSDTTPASCDALTNRAQAPLWPSASRTATASWSSATHPATVCGRRSNTRSPPSASSCRKAMRNAKRA